MTLRLDQLVVARGGRPVVQGVSLEVPAGEVTALLGPNGAGKSSLVLAVGGILKPAGGHVYLGEAELTGRYLLRVYHKGSVVCKAKVDVAWDAQSAQSKESRLCRR